MCQLSLGCVHESVLRFKVKFWSNSDVDDEGVDKSLHSQTNISRRKIAPPPPPQLWAIEIFFPFFLLCLVNGVN
jgi:hypothetical protein